MKRTRQRALAAGTVSAGSALAFGTVLGLAGFTLLAWRTNAATVVLGVIGFADYVILYGISKRRFSQGTLVGSISGAAPIAAGYTAVSGRFDTTALILFLIMVLWQMPHFYAIAMYRYNDYKQAGLPVLPVSRGNELAKRRIVYYIAALTAAIVALKLASRAGYVYLVICLAVNSYWLARAITTYSKPALEWGRSMFKYSLLVLCVFSAAIAFGSLLP